MPIDPEADELIHLNDAPAVFEAEGGGAVSRTGLYNWANLGLKGPRVLLETVRVKGKLYTTRAAVARFIAATRPPN